jgi:Domain of unknown function (DUF397)
MDLTSAPWRKSSYSGSNGGDCIEVAPGFVPGVVPLRDSKDPRGPALLLTAAAFASFVTAVKSGDAAFAQGEQYLAG